MKWVVGLFRLVLLSGAAVWMALSIFFGGMVAANALAPEMGKDAVMLGFSFVVVLQLFPVAAKALLIEIPGRPSPKWWERLIGMAMVGSVVPLAGILAGFGWPAAMALFLDNLPPMQSPEMRAAGIPAFIGFSPWAAILTACLLLLAVWKFEFDVAPEPETRAGHAI